MDTSMVLRLLPGRGSILVLVSSDRRQLGQTKADVGSSGFRSDGLTPREATKH